MIPSARATRPRALPGILVTGGIRMIAAAPFRLEEGNAVRTLRSVTDLEYEPVLT